MINASLCAMGGLTPMPVLSALNTFPKTSCAPAGAEPMYSNKV
jgi:hypothetical protein